MRTLYKHTLLQKEVIKMVELQCQIQGLTVDLTTIQELLGHKSIVMTKRYSHPTPEHKKKAVEKLNITQYGLPQIYQPENQRISANYSTMRNKGSHLEEL